jgi:hypothetical protein
MMEEPFDVEILAKRVRLVASEIRKSDLYPALIGGIAGGIAGALIAAVIARGVSARQTEGAPISRNSAASTSRGWSLREAAELMAIIAPLAKQAQAWYKTQRRG